MTATCSTPSMVPGHTCGLPQLHDGVHKAFHKGATFAVWKNREKEVASDVPSMESVLGRLRGAA